MHEWSHGQVWDNLIIIEARKRFVDGDLNRACIDGTNLLEETRRKNEVRDNIFQMARSHRWQIPDIDYYNKMINSSRVVKILKIPRGDKSTKRAIFAFLDIFGFTRNIFTVFVLLSIIWAIYLTHIWPLGGTY